MSRRKVSPEAQIIALFTGLSDEGKRMVMFGLNAIMSNEAPKQSGKKRTGPKGAMCNVCANEEDHPDRDMTYLSSHPFTFGAQAVPKRSSRKSRGEKSTASTDAPPTSVGVAASISGD